ncbi:MAG TPA: hypothetical protein VL354_02660, partial [Spirochaetia bacterium]|nr:hypothetical protein [Spirochaetia bacterium]
MPIGLQRDPIRPKPPLESHQESWNLFFQSMILCFCCCGAAEPLQLLGYLDYSIHRLEGFGEVGARRFSEGSVAREQTQATLDSCVGVVELMSNTGREYGQSFQPLRANYLCLQGPPFRHVCRYRNDPDQFSVFIEKR